MPLFEHEYFERSRSPDGKSLPIRSAAFLQRMGPVLQVVVSVTKEHAEKLAKQAQPVPEAVAGFALIDTGASITAVDEGVCQKLRLAPTGVVTMSHAGGTERRSCYPVQIVFPGTQLSPLANPMVVSFKPVEAPQRYVLLFGRDLLRNLRMVYHGPAGRIELAF